MCKKNIDKDYEKAKNCKMSIIFYIITAILAAIFVSVIYIDVQYYFVINSGKNICHGNSDMMVNYILIMLACITLTFAVSALVPYLISKNTIKNEINNLFKEKYKIGLNKSIKDFLKTDANSLRMTAVLLYHSEKYIWSIGWMSNAIRRYSKIKDSSNLNDSTYENISSMCIRSLVENIINVVERINDNGNTSELKEIVKKQFNEDNDEPKNSLIIRSLTDLIDCRIAYRKSSGPITFAETSEQKNIIDSFIKLVLVTLSKEEHDKCKKQSKYGKNERFNKEFSKFLPNPSKPYYMHKSTEHEVSNDILIALTRLKNAIRKYKAKKEIFE